MKTYIVLYREEYLLPADPPLGFRCEADDTEHAEEQCDNAYPGCDIVWIWEGDSLQDALDDYWQLLEECGQ